MSLPNDSIDVTPGSGATIAAQLISSKKYEVWCAANSIGHLYRAHDTYLAWLDATAGLVIDNTEAYWDIFNASGSGIKLRILRVVTLATDLGPNASLGAQPVQFCRTTAAGSTGTTVTPRPLDTNASALPAQVTMRTQSQLTPTFSTVLMTPHFRDTVADTLYFGLRADRNGPKRWRIQPEILAEGQGLALRGAGSGFIAPISLVVFSTEPT